MSFHQWGWMLYILLPCFVKKWKKMKKLLPLITQKVNDLGNENELGLLNDKVQLSKSYTLQTSCIITSTTNLCRFCVYKRAGRWLIYMLFCRVQCETLSQSCWFVSNPSDADVQTDTDGQSGIRQLNSQKVWRFGSWNQTLGSKIMRMKMKWVVPFK